MTELTRKRLALGLVGALLFGLVFVFFVRTMDFAHLRLDDAGYTVNCPFVKDGLSAANVFAAFAEPGNGAIWMPLTYVSYMVDISLWGGGWAAFHFTNVVLHALNAMLLFLFLRTLLPRFGCARTSRVACAAFFAALVWAVHPMRAEAVAWVAARKEEMWTLLALLASLSWLRFLRQGSRVAAGVAFALFLAACCSKPTAMCFPIWAWLLQKCAAPERKPRLAAYLPFVLVSVAIGGLTIYSQTNPTEFRQIDIYDTSLGWRLLNAAVSLGLYLAHFVVPVGIHFDYRAVFEGLPRQTGLGLTVLCVAALAFAAALWRVRSSNFRRVLVLSAGGFFVSLLPALGVFGIVGDHACADRYVYFAAAAASLLLAWFLTRLPCRPVWMGLGLVVLLAGEGALAWPVVGSFRNDQTAFSRVLAHDAEHPRALHYLGAEYCAKAGRFEEGLKMIRRSQELSPRPSTAATLAYLLAHRGQMGDFDEVRRLGRAVLADPKQDKEGMMLDALGVAAIREGKDRNAIAFFSAALSAPRRAHTKSHAMLNLAIALANIGRDAEALSVLGELRNLRDRWVRNRALEVSMNIRQNPRRPRIPWKD